MQWSQAQWYLRQRMPHELQSRCPPAPMRHKLLWVTLQLLQVGAPAGGSVASSSPLLPPPWLPPAAAMGDDEAAEEAARSLRAPPENVRGERGLDNPVL